MNTAKKCMLSAFIVALAFSEIVSAQKTNLSAEDVNAAILAGQKAPGWGNPLWWKIGVTLIQFSHDSDWMDVYVYTPTEWIKLQGRLSSTNLKPYESTSNDLANLLRIVVVTGTGNLRYSCSQVSNIVLRDVRKAITIQPMSYAPTSDVYQNLFGATQMCMGAIATFSMDDLAKVRNMDPKREFLVTTAAEGETPTDHKIKEKEFSRLD